MTGVREDLSVEELAALVCSTLERHGVLRLLAPTECVMDRLAGFYHWNDRQCLEQAVEVARRQPIDLARIEKWSRNEGSLAKFREFEERLA